MSYIRNLTLSIILLQASFNICTSQQKTARTAVAFYNLENLFDTLHDAGKFDQDFTPDGLYHYTDAIYKKKLHNMATVLSQLAIENIPDGPALIGLAEVENEKVLQDLIQEPELKKRNLRIIHFESPDSRGIDVALLYHPKYFKVIAAKALPVDIMENNKKENTRDVLYVIGQSGDDTFHVFVNHWPSRRGGETNTEWKRAKAANTNKNFIDGIMTQNPNAKVIVMGDLNDDPTDPSITKILGAIANKSAVKPDGLFNPWAAFLKKGIGTIVYNDSWNLFDQIIVSYGFINPATDGWKFQKAEIFNREFLKTSFGKHKGYPLRSLSGTTWINGYSDHFPTIIYLTK